MKAFFKDDKGVFSMGRLLAFLAGISGISVGCMICIITALKGGDMGSNAAFYLTGLVAIGIGGKAAQKFGEKK
jgi:hypothetical protein